MNLGEKINYYRKSRGLMQSELGAQLFVTRQTVSLWEKGQTLPSLENIVRLAEIFGITIDELLRGEIPSEASESEPSSEDKEEPVSPAIEDEAPKDAIERGDTDLKETRSGRFAKFFKSKYAIVLTAAAIVLLIAVIILLARGTSDKTITDEKIEEVIGTSLPEYESRTVLSKVKETEAVRIAAVTEILFKESAMPKLSATMKSELPSGIDALIDSAFLYRGCELYAVYDVSRERRASGVGDKGCYVFASYDEETRILRITEFEYK